MEGAAFFARGLAVLALAFVAVFLGAVAFLAVVVFVVAFLGAAFLATLGLVSLSFLGLASFCCRSVLVGVVRLERG